MPNNIKIGQIGEDLACQYLLNNKYKIIDRNYREKWGEIDIICKDKNGVLVFIEVKTLKLFHDNVKQLNGCFTPLEISRPDAAEATPLAGRSLTGLTPEDNLSQSKLNKVKRTAYLYANNHPELIRGDRGWRIDLVAIEICHSDPNHIDLQKLIKYCQLRHYENI